MASRTLKYVAVRDSLVDLIDAGVYSTGKMIPSERELMETYGVSRITVRAALDSLVQDGRLVRIQGKGTYVRDGVGRDLISLTSFSEDMRSRGMSVSRNVLSLEVEDADAAVADALAVPRGSKVLRFNRVFLADAQPVNHTISYLPLDLFPGLEKRDLVKESLYRIIEEDYGIEIVHARRMLDAVLATKDDAVTLGVTQGDPLIYFQGFTYGKVRNPQGEHVERVVETFTCRYRSNPNRFDISQVREIPGVGPKK